MSEVYENRRRFLVATTSLVAIAGAVTATIPFIGLLWFNSVLTVSMNILFRFCFDRFPVNSGTEIICLAQVDALINGSRATDSHAANWVLETSFAILVHVFPMPPVCQIVAASRDLAAHFQCCRRQHRQLIDLQIALIDNRNARLLFPGYPDASYTSCQSCRWDRSRETGFPATAY